MSEQVDEEGGPSDAQLDDLDLSADTFDGTPVTGSTTIRLLLSPGEEAEFEVSFALVGDDAVHNGDIIVASREEIERREAANRHGHYAHVLTLANGTWKDGIVPYRTDAPSRQLAQRVSKYFEGETPIRLVPWEEGLGSFVHFRRGEQNKSQVGRAFGSQIIWLTAGATLGTAIHEVCHALGMYHEHCRPDRDKHIDVLWENIEPGSHRLFDNQEKFARPETIYDVDSIMHYRSVDLARPGKFSMLRKDGRPIGPKSGLSPLDRIGLRKLYPTLEWT